MPYNKSNPRFSNVSVSHFNDGDNTGFKEIEVIKAFVHTSSVCFPYSTMTSCRPLEKRQYNWIEYNGKKYPVRKSKITNSWELILATGE